MPTISAKPSSPAVRARVAPPGIPDVASTTARHFGIAEKLSKAVDPNSTASTATVPGRTGRGGQVVEGIAHHYQPAASVPPQGRQPRRDDTVDLERIAA